MRNSKILIVGTINNFCLETSYSSSAIQLGMQVVRFDPSREVKKHIKLGKVGKALHDFWPVDVWTRKMNRELIVLAKNEQPDILFIAGGAKVYYGTLTTIKIILPQCKVVWIWPDTPMNLNESILSCGGLFDLSATYSKSTLKEFTSLGFKNPHWIPLAGDWSLHGRSVLPTNNFERDVSFVGMWRPEREKYLKIINDNFAHLKIEIYGNYWKRNCQDKELLKRWKGDGFYATDLADHFNKSRINLNVIDDTNYPAANMRFFEIPTSGGLQLSSSCPELENEFIDGEDILYFRNDNELIEKITWAMLHTDEVQKIRLAANEKIKQAHTYTHRLESIIRLLN